MCRREIQSDTGICECVGTGIRNGLKNRCPNGIEGSIPFARTTIKTLTAIIIIWLNNECLVDKSERRLALRTDEEEK